MQQKIGSPPACLSARAKGPGGGSPPEKPCQQQDVNSGSCIVETQNMRLVESLGVCLVETPDMSCVET